MTLSHALSLAALGFEVFPLVYESKLPAIDDFPHRASSNPEKLRLFWVDPVLELEQPHNVGISTSRFKGGALLVVDIDCKNGKDGESDLLRLELEGFSFPPTLEQKTPSGRHLIYSVEKPVKPSVGELARGIDTRSRGGFIVGQGSVFEGRAYTLSNKNPIARAPQWLVERFKEERGEPSRKPVAKNLSPQSIERATEYLVKHAPLAIEGQGGDQTTFAVAAKLKDFGLDEETSCELLIERWNNRCSPPWDLNELRRKVSNAYAYGANAVGSNTPEACFTPIVEPVVEKKLTPFQKLNQQYAFIVTGGKARILREFTGRKGPAYQLLEIDAFHMKEAPNKNEEGVAYSKRWIASPERRSYDGFDFYPGKPTLPCFYNVWRGFAVTPLSVGETPTLDMEKALRSFLEHSLKNVCGGDEILHRWLMTYFAHLVQKPWEMPLVAIVMRGGKGVGKSALAQIMGSLFGKHFGSFSNAKTVLGNFNGVLEDKVLIILEEAVWGGNKTQDSALKELITARIHNIERKGFEVHEADNFARTIIIGNEDWLVPASNDERRYAVFNVGDGNKQDRSFFREMRERMEAGGNRLLLRYLLDFDITKADVTLAPITEGLADQKRLSLAPFHQWWEGCLIEGRIMGQATEWQSDIAVTSLRNSFYQYFDERRVSGWRPNENKIGQLLKQCLPTLTDSKPAVEGVRVRHYHIGSLDHARKCWDEFFGHKTAWESENLEEVG